MNRKEVVLEPKYTNLLLYVKVFWLKSSWCSHIYWPRDHRFLSAWRICWIAPVMSNSMWIPWSRCISGNAALICSKVVVWTRLCRRVHLAAKVPNDLEGQGPSFSIGVFPSPCYIFCVNLVNALIHSRVIEQTRCQTDRQTDRQTDIQTDRHSWRQYPCGY